MLTKNKSRRRIEVIVIRSKRLGVQVPVGGGEVRDNVNQKWKVL